MQDIGNNLILCAVGAWRDHIGLELLSEIRERGCSVQDCHLGSFGEAYVCQMLISGNWNCIGKLETALPAIGQKLELQLQSFRTNERGERPDMRPFAVEMNAPEQADLLVHIYDFFANQELPIIEMVCQSYSAGQTGARMANIQLVALLPVSAQPPALRESFMDLCDDLNADGMLDPIKN